MSDSLRELDEKMAVAERDIARAEQASAVMREALADLKSEHAALLDPPADNTGRGAMVSGSRYPHE